MRRERGSLSSHCVRPSVMGGLDVMFTFSTQVTQVSSKLPLKQVVTHASQKTDECTG